MTKTWRSYLWLALAAGGVVVTGIAALYDQPVSNRGMDVVVNGEAIPATMIRSMTEKLVEERGGNSGATTGVIVDALIDQELLYQAGERQGLLKSDPVIRHRVVQLVLEKIEAGIDAPDKADLMNYYAEHERRYATDTQIRFRQLFFSTAGSNESLVLQQAQSIADNIHSAEEFEATEQAWQEQLRIHSNKLAYTKSRLISLYGTSFTEKLLSTDTGKQLAPLTSSLGVHLVWIVEKIDSYVRPFEQIQAQIARDWNQDQKTKATQAYLEKLRSGAKIHIPESVHSQ